MKKHIFGFAMFCLIVASFALVYTFFYAPAIPPKETVKPPVALTEVSKERPYTCRMNRNKVSYEVQSAVFDFENNKFISKITLYWEGRGTPPKEILVEPELFTLENVEKSVADSKAIGPKTLVDPFKDGDQATVTIEYNFVQSNQVSRDNNMYVVFNFRDKEGDYLMKTNKTLPEAYQVLVNFGKSPTVKTMKMIKGTTIPQ